MFPLPEKAKEAPIDGNQTLSYFYIGWWSYKFYFRQAILGRVAPIALLLMFGLDILGPITHVMPITESARTRYFTAFTLLAVAVVLILHHHRLRRRIERLQLVLTSTMVLLDFQSTRHAGGGRPDGEMKRRHAVTQILDAFVFALEKNYSGGGVAASVVIRDSQNGPFLMYAQDPRRTFSEHTILDHTRSAAGYTSRELPGTLLYVPRTEYTHAARIGAEGSGGDGHGVFRKARIVPNAFQACAEDPEHLKSLLCVRVPLRDGPASKCAILCISRKQCDGMGDLEFHAIKLAAALVGLALLG